MLFLVTFWGSKRILGIRQTCERKGGGEITFIYKYQRSSEMTKLCSKKELSDGGIAFCCRRLQNNRVLGKFRDVLKRMNFGVKNTHVTCNIPSSQF